jgi:hypothetical protein
MRRSLHGRASRRVEAKLAFVAAVLLYCDLASRCANLGQRALPLSILARPDALAFLLFLLAIFSVLETLVDCEPRRMRGAIDGGADDETVSRPCAAAGRRVRVSLRRQGQRTGVQYRWARADADDSRRRDGADGVLPRQRPHRQSKLAGQSIASHLYAQLGVYVAIIPGVLVIVIIASIVAARALWKEAKGRRLPEHLMPRRLRHRQPMRVELIGDRAADVPADVAPGCAARLADESRRRGRAPSRSSARIADALAR